MERPNFIKSELEFHRIGEGRRLETYDLGTHIIKSSKKKEKTDVFQLAQEFSNQYKMLKKHLGDYVVTSDFVVGQNKSTPQVFIVQPDTHGVPFKNLSEKQLKTHYVTDFLEKSLQVYEDYGLMPDIYGRPHVVKWYTHPQTSPNVVVSNKNGFPYPNLIDVLFTRNSQKPLVGKLHSRLLYEGTSRLLKRLT